MTVRARTGKTLSLVVPMHDEADGLALLFERLDSATTGLDVAVEIVCVDDGSRDGTLAALRDRAAADERVRVVALSRNFGKEAALTAGLDAARGDMVVPLDADLQDPPELIAEFLALWEQGYDVVYGVRTDRSSDSFTKRQTASIFYRLFNGLSDYPIPDSAGDFRLMDRAVVEALKQLPERNRFMKGLFSWVGFRQAGVPYARPPRAAGGTSWSYRKLFRFALDGLTAFTTAPLRVWTGVGVVSALLAVIWALVLIVRVLVVGRDVPGYASLMVVILFAFAIQMIALGILGEYVGRMYQEVKQRPTYLVRERIGFGEDA
ncbi:glycosyltransferase family 2 protein [Phenylobacterium sp. J426]|uniref:glycosyltransferase family 2 protein n=1 Tax=Phenylobacterium sp. J426 TaxID=2898439 RepID=UPI00215087E3|nr:glycosyltransferase family 2 protein [Phenylobacterium sp. J426]MCR5873071.1 glycosyltransferase family 2 protein [Phenylobacterium sp. J426]